MIRRLNPSIQSDYKIIGFSDSVLLLSNSSIVSIAITRLVALAYYRTGVQMLLSLHPMAIEDDVISCRADSGPMAQILEKLLDGPFLRPLSFALSCAPS